jgi:two-component system chemotaxis response regulator CheY
MAEEKNTKKYSILLVDDDKFLLDMYSMKFKESGCEVNGIADPAKALESLRGGMKPDIILLDVVMPAMNGFDFLEKVRAEKLVEGTAIVMLSNQGQQEDIDRAMKLGAAGYIIKASSIPSEVLEKTIAIASGKK